MATTKHGDKAITALAEIISSGHLSVSVDAGEQLSFVGDTDSVEGLIGALTNPGEGSTNHFLSHIKDGVDTLISIMTMVLTESFDETDLSNDDYTFLNAYSDGIIGVGVVNNNSENALTLTVGDIDVVVPAGGSFYEVFETNTEVTVTGTSLDFNAYIKGNGSPLT